MTLIDLDRYQSDFAQWVNDQVQSPSIFVCNYEVRFDFPLPYATDAWSVWAAQSCKDYDLVLTLYLDELTYLNSIGYIGAGLSEKGCNQLDYLGEEDPIMACEFELFANKKNFGMLFAGSFRPFFYMTEWRLTEVVPPVFEWW